jgi:flagellum-specific ATP synthase
MVTSAGQQECARDLRELMAAYTDIEDLVSIGAYKPGTKPIADRALERWDAINVFLRQRKDEATAFTESASMLQQIIE